MSDMPAAAPSRPSIPIIRSIAPLAAEFDVWFLDIWGVVHNGVRPFDGAMAACAAFRGQGGAVILVSNSPRPAPRVAEQLDGIGVPRATWDRIVSSGDVARALIANYAGRSVYHLGPQRDLGIFEGLGVTLGDESSAAAIVCTGLFDDERETAEDYAGRLSGPAGRQVPMICANPDLTVERDGRIIPCAGAVAAVYERLGGQVAYAGKPYAPIYETALELAGDVLGSVPDKSKILAIGDGVRTDIAGAATAGVKAVFIASGVHVEAGADLNDTTLGGLFADAARAPIAAMTALVW